MLVVTYVILLFQDYTLLHIILIEKRIELKSMNTALSNLPDSWNEVDQLISLLRSWGVNYLVGLNHTANRRVSPTEQMSAVELIRRLAHCDEYPRVRDAT